MAAYVIACVGVSWGDEFSRWLMKNIVMPGWLSQHIKAMTELARGLFPYIAASVMFVLGFGGHLPGTRVRVENDTK
jgi:hypothetical protein